MWFKVTFFGMVKWPLAFFQVTCNWDIKLSHWITWHLYVGVIIHFLSTSRTSPLKNVYRSTDVWFGPKFRTESPEGAEKSHETPKIDASEYWCQWCLTHPRVHLFFLFLFYFFDLNRKSSQSLRYSMELWLCGRRPFLEIATPWKLDIAREKWWLEDDTLLLGW